MNQVVTTGFQIVAPHVGAWIEIREECIARLEKNVAPHVGAWIEISKTSCNL